MGFLNNCFFSNYESCKPHSINVLEYFKLKFYSFLYAIPNYPSFILLDLERFMLYHLGRSFVLSWSMAGQCSSKFVPWNTNSVKNVLQWPNKFGKCWLNQIQNVFLSESLIFNVYFTFPVKGYIM